jgi:hypothetical protein
MKGGGLANRSPPMVGGGESEVVRVDFLPRPVRSHP